MCASVLDVFGISPDIDLAVMTPRQSLTDLTSAVLQAMEGLLATDRPDWLVVQGDTTTAFAASLAAFYSRVPVAHVEAGLRTRNIYSPWPEEMNRRLISTVASWHFAPMSSNRDILQREGIDLARVVVTGNTGIDALKWLVRRLYEDLATRMSAQAMLDATGLKCLAAGACERFVLITAHRRESLGEGFIAICRAIATLATRFPDRHFIYPVHPNPAVRDTVFRELGNDRFQNIHLIESLDYLSFIFLLSRAELVLTDSGGIQEEAPSLGTRVIVMRQVTERTEGLETGLVRIAGTDQDRIIAEAESALTGRWSADPNARDVYGDGEAAERILTALAQTSTAC